MPETFTPTPGAVAYEAYCAFGAHITKTRATPWSWLAPVEHAQWETAAQAVLDAWQVAPRQEDTP